MSDGSRIEHLINANGRLLVVSRCVAGEVEASDGKKIVVSIFRVAPRAGDSLDSLHGLELLLVSRTGEIESERHIDFDELQTLLFVLHPEATQGLEAGPGRSDFADIRYASRSGCVFIARVCDGVVKFSIAFGMCGTPLHLIGSSLGQLRLLVLQCADRIVSLPDFRRG